MAVCCATQLVASTVVCSYELLGLILFKLRGFGLCIGLIVDCV